MKITNKTKLEKFMKDNKMVFTCVQDMDDPTHTYRLGIVFNTMNPETGHDSMTVGKAKEILIKLGTLVNGN